MEAPSRAFRHPHRATLQGYISGATDPLFLGGTGGRRRPRLVSTAIRAPPLSRSHPSHSNERTANMATEKYRVGEKAPGGLNLRSEPVVKDTTRRALLPMGHLVLKKADSGVANWWEVSATLDGATVEGFVNHAYLVKESAFTPPQAVNSISPVHLSPTTRVARAAKTGMAFPLNEPGQKTRSSAATPAVKARELTAIVDWLDVENKQRYAPTSQHTYCNIYAYDYCYLAGVYLPRVWWTASALNRLRNGTPVSPIYGQTVSELNANSLFNWLKDHGASFGWRRSFDPTELQNAANDGQVAIICAQNIQPNVSGHICPVVPETAAHKAARNASTVARPLQSQAGRTNRKYFTSTWWPSARFREFGFWINA
jgi:hypothetical protein